MAESLSLSLQAFPTVNKGRKSLEYLIERINEQKGSFRNVTEASLEEEIQALDNGEAEASEDDVLESVDDVEDIKFKREAVTTAREEIIKQVFQAHSESSQALDFVSLLLSKYSPSQSQTTLSAFLKQNLPLGSLGGEVVQAPQVLEIEKRNARMASIGWRMKSLNSAADSLLKSASRLEEEVEKETRYWSQALTVKEKGWSLSRLPREKHTLGVRYGFAEAYSDFRDRGLAALRREEDGSLSLDRGFRSMGDRTIRVRLLHQGKPIASSITAASKPVMDDSVEAEILNARNSIFDEELHHEIHREARNLVNQGVRCVGTSILIPFGSNKQLEINLVSTEDNTPDNAAEYDIGSGRIVQNAILVLRILLSDAHRQNLRSRSKKPPVLRESKPPRQLYPILKPIVEYLQHRSHVRTLRDFLAEVRATIEKAGLSIVVGMTESSYNIASISDAATESGHSKAEALVKHLTSPLNSTMAINIIDDSTVVNFDIQTTLSIPEATTFNVVNKEVPPLSPISQLPHSTQYTTLVDVENCITHLTTLSLLHHILSKFGDWHTFSPHGTSIMRNRPGTRDREIVSLVLAKGQLSMTWQRSGSLNDQGLWTWEAEDVEGTGETRSMMDVFQQLQ